MASYEIYIFFNVVSARGSVPSSIANAAMRVDAVHAHAVAAIRYFTLVDVAVAVGTFPAGSARAAAVTGGACGSAAVGACLTVGASSAPVGCLARCTRIPSIAGTFPKGAFTAVGARVEVTTHLR